MARLPTQLPALDQRRQVRLSDLTMPTGDSLNSQGTLRWWYDQARSLRMNWRIRLTGDQLTTAQPGLAQLELSYPEAGGEVHQPLQLVRLPSNLGRGGGVWYALCPRTGRRCRTLYEDAGGFVSRAGIEGVLYRSQQLSKADRGAVGGLARHRRLIELTESWWLRPGIKRSYGGRLTRPMRRWLKLEQTVRSSSPLGIPSVFR